MYEAAPPHFFAKIFDQCYALVSKFDNRRCSVGFVKRIGKTLELLKEPTGDLERNVADLAQCIGRGFASEIGPEDLAFARAEIARMREVIKRDDNQWKSTPGALSFLSGALFAILEACAAFNAKRHLNEDNEFRRSVAEIPLNATILKYLTKEKDMRLRTSIHIAARIGKSRRTIERHLYSMLCTGLVDRMHNPSLSREFMYIPRV